MVKLKYQSGTTVTNDGNVVFYQGEHLRSTILKLSSSESCATYSHLKFLALDLKFQLSGYGYFKLNRTVFTSVNKALNLMKIILK